MINALYSCMVQPPPETATFRALDSTEMSAMSRPFHVILLSSPRAVADLLEEFGPFAGEEDKFWYGSGPWLWTCRVTHIILALMPLFWVSGLFPPLEALLLWLGEQLQVRKAYIYDEKYKKSGFILDICIWRNNCNQLAKTTHVSVILHNPTVDPLLGEPTVSAHDFCHSKPLRIHPQLGSAQRILLPGERFQINLQQASRETC